jgi:hypothetical protein
MHTVVIAFNYVDFKDYKKRDRQLTAMRVLKETPEWVSPIAFGFDGSVSSAEKCGIHAFNVLKRNSSKEIGNNRELPYIKEIMDWTAKIECGKIGYINSDILIGKEFLDAINENADAYIFSRSDIAETNCVRFCKENFKVIFGGDQHIGADGFFFKREWWINNRDQFSDDLIIGETEWDTCYRTIIKNECSNYIERRCLYHVYHDAQWSLDSPGAKNNIAIWKSIKRNYEKWNRFTPIS